MGRWQALIDELIANLAVETPSEKLRTNIDHKIREAETRASNLAAPATLAKKSVHRKQEFQAALRLTLGALRVRDGLGRGLAVAWKPTASRTVLRQSAVDPLRFPQRRHVGTSRLLNVCIQMIKRTSYGLGG
jgi:hypothetical protein